jgi:alpha-tubulin suppressor-like RCC1 family protein
MNPNYWIGVAFVALFWPPGWVTAQAPLPPDPDYYGIRQWGQSYFDTDSRLLPVVDIAAHGQWSGVVRSDGRLFVQGQDYPGVCRAPAGVFASVALGDSVAFGVRPDGTVAQWGANAVWAIPVLPSGAAYTSVAAGNYHRVLGRSDGVVVAIGQNQFGQLLAPTLASGEVVTKAVASWNHSAVLTSNGRVLAWGDNAQGQCTVPPLPQGMTYTDLACGFGHMLAVRSDGALVGWGGNAFGEAVAPSLPPGRSYLKCAAGSQWSVAWRSDGQLVAWGRSGLEGNLMTPTAPPGVGLVKLVAGDEHGVALWSDGSVSGWGQESYFACRQPSPSRGNSAAVNGDRFLGVSCGSQHTLVLRADGTAEGYGNNAGFVCDVPQLPTGVTYTKVRAGQYLSAALRSDGQLVVWGLGPASQLPVPPLPVGVTYVDVDLGDQHVVALRSDGMVVAFGGNGSGQSMVPALPPGMTYVAIDANYLYSSLVRSDGTLVYFGTGGALTRGASVPGRVYVDSLQQMGLRDDGVVETSATASIANPWGVYVVDFDSKDSCVLLRRSDGQIVFVFVGSPQSSDVVPELEPGTSYLDVSGGNGNNAAARVGSTCFYVGMVPGCSGSRPASKLVPRDTPRIGRTLEVTLFDLPNDIAVMGMGFQSLPVPVDLGFLGMPGCSLAISVDAVLGLVGQGGKGKWQLPIPNQPALVGVHFYNQALVMDLGAGNSFGAVMSDAMEGVVGYP